MRRRRGRRPLGDEIQQLGRATVSFRIAWSERAPECAAHMIAARLEGRLRGPIETPPNRQKEERPRAAV